MRTNKPALRRSGRPAASGLMPEDPLDDDDEPQEPSDLEPTPTEPSDWEPSEIPCTDDDSNWDVFIPEDDERDPLPDLGDFPGYGTLRRDEWIEKSQEPRASNSD